MNSATALATRSHSASTVEALVIIPSPASAERRAAGGCFGDRARDLARRRRLLLDRSRDRHRSLVDRVDRRGNASDGGDGGLGRFLDGGDLLGNLFGRLGRL